MAPYFLSAVFFVILDRVSKYLAIKYFKYNEVKILGEYFKLSYAENPYIAFSLPLSGIFLKLLIIGIIIAISIYIIFLAKKKNFFEAGLLLIVVFSAVSNVFDRFVYGAVIDYFDLKYFTVFNIADSVIVVSFAIFIYYSLIQKKYE